MLDLRKENKKRLLNRMRDIQFQGKVESTGVYTPLLSMTMFLHPKTECPLNSLHGMLAFGMAMTFSPPENYHPSATISILSLSAESMDWPFVPMN